MRKKLFWRTHWDVFFIISETRLVSVAFECSLCCSHWQANPWLAFLSKGIPLFLKCCQNLHGNVNVEVSLLVYTLQGDVASAVSQKAGGEPADLSLMPPWAWRGPAVEKSQTRRLSGTRLMVLLGKELKWRRRVGGENGVADLALGVSALWFTAGKN